MEIDRRDFIKLGSWSAAAVALGLDKAEAKGKPKLVSTTLDYKTILGNDPHMDKARYYEAMADHYGRMAGFLGEENGLEIPEDAAIRFIKPESITISVDERRTRSKKHTRTVRKYQRGNTIIREWEFNLKKYARRNSEMLKELTETITKGYESKEAQAQALLCFVQTAVAYDREKVRKLEKNSRHDFVRTPERTLLDKLGDCKDTSVLYASLLLQMRVNPAFLYYDSHVNVGVPLDFKANRIPYSPKRFYFDGVVEHKGTEYFIAETTPEVPMYIGRIMIAQKGREIKRVRPV